MLLNVPDAVNLVCAFSLWTDTGSLQGDVVINYGDGTKTVSIASLVDRLDTIEPNLAEAVDNIGDVKVLCPPVVLYLANHLQSTVADHTTRLAAAEKTILQNTGSFTDLKVQVESEDATLHGRISDINQILSGDVDSLRNITGDHRETLGSLFTGNHDGVGLIL